MMQDFFYKSIDDIEIERQEMQDFIDKEEEKNIERESISYESFGEYDGSLDTFFKKVPKHTLDMWECIFPNYKKELEENKTYYKEPITGDTILHAIACYFHTIGKECDEGTEFPFEILSKKGIFDRNNDGETPFNYMCDNADWQGVGPTRYLQTQIEKYILKNYPEFDLASCYNDNADEDKLYYRSTQDDILKYISRCNAEKFIESL